MQTRESASDPQLVADQYKNNKNILRSTLATDLAVDRRVYFSETFARIMAAYHEGSLQERINGAIVQNAQQLTGRSVFYLYWTDQSLHLHPLRVTLSCKEVSALGRSQYLIEEDMSVLVQEHRQQVNEPSRPDYRLEVEQITSAGASFKDLPLLTMWFAMNGMVGELCDVMPGKNFSGSEVLRVYQYFANFLKIENMFICDDAVLGHKHAHSSVAIRLISALVSGKTWFEKELPGLKLFESRNLPIQQNFSVHQNSYTRNKSLRELQELSLVEWHRMLKGNEQEILRHLQSKFLPQTTRTYSIFRKNKPIKNNQGEINFGAETLQSLTAAVYRDARSKNSVTAELHQIFHLLCGNIVLDFGNIPLDRKSSDYWVKSRVHHLMWGSYLWVQRVIDDESKKSLLL